MIEELLSIYESELTNQKFILNEDRYEDYIRYIERIDHEGEEIFWRNYLKGLAQTTLLPFISNTNQRNKGLGNYESEFLSLKKDIALDIQNYSRRHHITLNTLIQGIWTYLLHYYTSQKHISFGVIVVPYHRCRKYLKTFI